MSAVVCFGQSPLKKVTKRLLNKLFSGSPYVVYPSLLQAYHAHEIAVMYQSSSRTLKFRVLTEKLMRKRLSDHGTTQDAK